MPVKFNHEIRRATEKPRRTAQAADPGATPLPDLFRRRRKEAKVLYPAYLIELRLRGREARVVAACRQIRMFARRRGNSRWGDFTYHFEIDALCSMGKYPIAWRQLRRLEIAAFGKHINLRGIEWRSDEVVWLGTHHVPVLYFLRRYRLAARLLEALLTERMKRPCTGLSYSLSGYVYNPLAEPLYRYDVTLHHIYRKLGKRLAELSQLRG